MNWFLSRAKKAENLPETALRVLILGSSNVGKTTLIDAITKQESPKPIYTPTYGCNLQIQVLNSH